MLGKGLGQKPTRKTHKKIWKNLMMGGKASRKSEQGEMKHPSKNAR